MSKVTYTYYSKFLIVINEGFPVEETIFFQELTPFQSVIESMGQMLAYDKAKEKYFNAEKEIHTISCYDFITKEPLFYYNSKFENEEEEEE